MKKLDELLGKIKRRREKEAIKEARGYHDKFFTKDYFNKYITERMIENIQKNNCPFCKKELEENIFRYIYLDFGIYHKKFAIASEGINECRECGFRILSIHTNEQYFFLEEYENDMDQKEFVKTLKERKINGGEKRIIKDGILSFLVDKYLDKYF